MGGLHSRIKLRCKLRLSLSKELTVGKVLTVSKTRDQHVNIRQDEDRNLIDRFKIRCLQVTICLEVGTFVES
jgi:hypothetical protein